MLIPDSLRDSSYRERKRAKARIAREAKRQMAAMSIVPNLQFGRKPSNILLVLAVMIVIGGILIGRAGSRSVAQRRRTLEDLAVKELTVLRMALDCFKGECGRYPKTEEGLEALVKNLDIPGWDGPYVNIVKPDPWKHHYVYARENEEITLLSCGPDGVKGTVDDVFPEMELSVKSVQ